MTASEAYNAALRLLAHRGRSIAELKERLRRKGFSECETESALQRCRDLGYLDDRRFALERARHLLLSGKAGPRLMQDLRQRGVDEKTARAAIAEAEDEIRPQQVLAEIARRKFPRFRYESAEPKEKRRTIAFLQRRGFSLEMILSYFRERDADETSHDDR